MLLMVLKSKLLDFFSLNITGTPKTCLFEALIALKLKNNSKVLLQMLFKHYFATIGGVDHNGRPLSRREDLKRSTFKHYFELFSVLIDYMIVINLII